MSWHSMEAMTVAGCTTRRGIRHWESEGLLGPVERSSGNTRRYTDAQIALAKIIAAAQFASFDLDTIKQMLIEWDEEVYEAICTRLTLQIKMGIRLIEDLPRPPVVEYDL